MEAHWSASLGQCCTISLGSTCSARLRGRRSSIQMLTETSFTSYMWASLRKLQFWFESWCTDCLVAVSSSLPVIVWGEHCCILETKQSGIDPVSELSARKQMSRYSFNISENLADTWLLRQMMMLILEWNQTHLYITWKYNINKHFVVCKDALQTKMAVTIETTVHLRQ